MPKVDTNQLPEKPDLPTFASATGRSCSISNRVMAPLLRRLKQYVRHESAHLLPALGVHENATQGPE
jgi:hypothetical protein